MKIGVPTCDDAGLDSGVHGHFGSAPYFLVYDTDSEQHQFLDNTGQVHEHGRCNPLAVFMRSPIDVLLTAGIGAGALFRLNEAGIKTFRCAPEDSASAAIREFRDGALPEISPLEACGHHGHQHQARGPHGCH
jgi:predicted Fe-Mo cluster-binding NifX family protein